MQLYALDQNLNVISARNALKHHKYQCLECQSNLCLRGGLKRQNHFYHLEANRSCRQNGKSMEHLQVQLFLQNQLTEKNCILEKRFQEINRIADVFWISENIVFEVQCSPISSEEIKLRNRDYAKLGIKVIWILHERQFNKARLSGAESYLQRLPHYFTNMNADGRGIIYDFFRLFDKGRKVFGSKRFFVDVSSLVAVSQSTLKQRKNMIPDLLFQKMQVQSFCFKGDLTDYCGSHSFAASFFEQAIKFQDVKDKKSIFSQAFFLLIRSYQILFRILLEKATS